MPDPLPAPAQGVPEAAGCRSTRSRRSLSRGLEKLGAKLARIVPGRGGAGAGRARRGRRGAQRAGRDPDRRRAAGHRAGWPVRPRRRSPTRTGAKLAWVPRRAGDRGAVDAGCLPNLLPGGRPVTDAAARAELAGAWDLAAGRHPEPGRPGHRRDHRRRRRRPARRAGGRPASTRPTWPTRGWPRRRSTRCGSWSAWSCGCSAVTRRADVVFPVAPVVEKAGTLPRLGGPAAHLRRGARHHRDDRRPGARRARRAARRARSAPATCNAIRRELGATAGDPGGPPGRAGGRRRPSAADARRRRGGAGDLAPPDRPGHACTDGDEVPGRHRPPAGGPARQGAPPRRSASPTATRSRSAPTGARSPCRRRSPTCPTAWSGCRPTRPARPCGAPSASPPARSSGSPPVRPTRSPPTRPTAGPLLNAGGALSEAVSGPGSDPRRLRQGPLVDRADQGRRRLRLPGAG